VRKEGVEGKYKGERREVKEGEDDGDLNPSH